jgi:serine/threonine-protein kinase
MLMGGGLAVIAASAVGGWSFLRPAPAAASDSIAVLPFDNLSGDPAQAYFSDGMAEELRSALTRIPDLRVVARTSSEAVRNEDVRTAAHRLGVSNILTGSVRRSATTMRISAQLVDGSTGLERWSEDFDQPIGDTLAIQSGIAQRVADALRIQLGAAAKAALTLGGTRNAEAQDHFLKATQGRLNDTAEGLQRSITELNTAIALDPNYVQAYASKSALLSIYGADWARSPSELALDLNEAVASAQRAIALAPNLAQGHSALGYL